MCAETQHVRIHNFDTNKLALLNRVHFTFAHDRNYFNRFERTENIFCLQFDRDMWLSWSEDDVTLGRGTIQGSDILVRRNVSTKHRVTTMSVSALIYNATFVFGEYVTTIP